MSLYGSLFSSVSGIQAQGTAIGIISDNISNVNTVGYKAGSQYFGTLITDSGSTTSYSPGGVRAQNRQLVSQQGLIQTTSSPLDVAISGNGMFVVSSGPDGLAGGEDLLYSRAGSFRTDASGNFINAAGYYLQAWSLDSDGNIPANSSSLETLQTVNIGEAFGDAAATTNVEVSINLNAAETILEGSGQTGLPGSDVANTENFEAGGDDIIIPNANIAVGDGLTVTTDATFSDTFTYGGFAQSNDIAGGILGSTTATNPFTATSGDSFEIVLNGDTANPYKFTYIQSQPTVTSGEFNSLQSLADAIDAIDGLTAKVGLDGGGATRLFVSGEDARHSVTFAAVNNTITGAASTVDFPSAGVLNLTDITATTTNRWNSMEGLALLANEETQGRLSAEVLNSNSANAQIKITNADPLTTIQFADTTGNILTEFGMSGAVQTAAYNAVAGSSALSMSAGNIEPDFQRSITIYDSLGAGHDIRMGFVKVGTNKWRVEIFAANADDIVSTVTGGDASDRFIAAGEVTFNGDGTLANFSPNWVASPPSVRWANGADDSTVAFDLGTAGDTDGLRQFDGLYNVANISQNGAAVGLLDSVSINEEGFVVANFNNGQSKSLYKIPIATFSNVNGLISRNGNVFIQSIGSGDPNLAEAGNDGAGTISPSSLESANTELSEELTDMIIAQRAYQASAKVITTADELLEELNRVT